MAANKPFSISKSAVLVPVASPTLTTQGELAFDSVADVLRIRNASSTDSVVQAAAAQTLTNKTLSGSSNTFSNIAYASLILTNSIVNADINSSAAIAYAKLALTGSIVNVDISNSAAIAYAKLALTGSIVNADISSSAAIAYSKLNLTGNIVNADISSSAAIAYSKLALSNSIVNADISSSAAIAYSKLANMSTGQVLVGNAGVATAATLSGGATVGATGVLTLSNTAVTGQPITGYVSGAGTVAATDTILQAIQKLNGNTSAISSAAITSLTGDVTATGPGAAAATIANNAVTNAKLAQVATATFKGRTTAGTGNSEDLTVTQATALLNIFTSSLKGLAPSSGGGTTNFLRADGTWANPGSGNIVGPGSSTDNAIVRWNGTSGLSIQNSGATVNDAGALFLSITGIDSGAGNSRSIGNVAVVNNSGAGSGEYDGINQDITAGAAQFVTGINNFLTPSSLSQEMISYYALWGGTAVATSGNAYSFYADPPSGGTLANYYGLYVAGVSTGTVSGNNDAIHVVSGRSYFGGNVNINGLSASLPVVSDVSKNLVSQSYATFTSNLSTLIGDSGSGGTKGLAPAPASGDAAANKFLKADGTWAVVTAGITSLTGDVTASGSGSVVATIANNAVTDAKLRQSAGLSVIGRMTNSTGNVADITAASDGQVLRRSATNVAFGAIDLANANAVNGNLPVANLNSGTGASATTFWRGDATWATPSGSGNVTGPGSSTDTAIARYNGVTGTILKDSTVTIGDNGNITVPITSSSSSGLVSIDINNTNTSTTLISEVVGIRSLITTAAGGAANRGILATLTRTGTSGNSSEQAAAEFAYNETGSGARATKTGVKISASAGGTTTTNNLVALKVDASNGSSGTATNVYGGKFNAITTTGTTTNSYGLWVGDGSGVGATISRSFHVEGGDSYFGGNIVVNNATASTALALDASKNIVSSATTATELGYVSGVTSAIQTQLNTKLAYNTVIKTTTYTAVTGDEIFANSSGGAFTITLPASPTIGNRVKIIDYSGNWATNNVTVGRNSQNINGSAANLTLNINNAWVELIFVDATQGWRIVT